MLSPALAAPFVQEFWQTPIPSGQWRYYDGLLYLLALVHTVLFWAGNVVLTPLILLATLVLDHKRTVHDLLLGTVVVRSDR